MSPRSPETNAALREASREKILTAAATLFAERGYQATSLASITREAGVATGLANYYFSSKRDLLASLLETALVRACEFVLSTAGDAPDTALATVIDGIIVAAASEPQAQALTLTVMIQPGVREVYAEVEQANSDLLAATEDRLRDLFAQRGADDPALEEVLLRSVLEGVTVKICIYPEQYPAEAVRRRLRALYDLPAPEQPLLPDTWTTGDRLRAES